MMIDMHAHWRPAEIADALRGPTPGPGVVGNEPVDGAAMGLGGVESSNVIRGFAAGGYRVRAPEIRGLAVATALAAHCSSLFAGTSTV